MVAATETEQMSNNQIEYLNLEEVVQMLVHSLDGRYVPGIPQRGQASPIPLSRKKGVDGEMVRFYVVNGSPKSCFLRENETEDCRLFSVKYKDFRQGCVFWSTSYVGYGLVSRKIHSLPRKTKSFDLGESIRQKFALNGFLHTLIRDPEGLSLFELRSRSWKKELSVSNLVEPNAARFLEYSASLKSLESDFAGCTGFRLSSPPLSTAPSTECSKPSHKRALVKRERKLAKDVSDCSESSSSSKRKCADALPHIFPSSFLLKPCEPVLKSQVFDPLDLLFEEENANAQGQAFHQDWLIHCSRQYSSSEVSRSQQVVPAGLALYGTTQDPEVAYQKMAQNEEGQVNDVTQLFGYQWMENPVQKFPICETELGFVSTKLLQEGSTPHSTYSQQKLEKLLDTAVGIKWRTCAALWNTGTIQKLFSPVCCPKLVQLLDDKDPRFSTEFLFPSEGFDRSKERGMVILDFAESGLLLSNGSVVLVSPVAKKILDGNNFECFTFPGEESSLLEKYCQFLRLVHNFNSMTVARGIYRIPNQKDVTIKYELQPIMKGRYQGKYTLWFQDDSEENKSISKLPD